MTLIGMHSPMQLMHPNWGHATIHISYVYTYIYHTYIHGCWLQSCCGTPMYM